MKPHRPPPLAEGSLLAAIDLGSNSFHLIITRLDCGELRPIDMLAERVQLGAGLSDGRLSQDAIERGLACLSRFAQMLSGNPPERIRVVGTNALRKAKNRREFTDPAEAILGVPVDVVYGREEARLIYLGVAHTLADDEVSRLVVDIGGGSTEFIIGQRFEPIRLESLQLGCVSYANQFFADGLLNKQNYQAAYEQAMIEVSHIRKNFHAKHWVECVGSSGTLQAIEALIRIHGWREWGIDRAAIEKLRKRLLKFDHVNNLKLEGLNDKRRDVITAGVAITAAIFDGLNITELRTSNGALREGVIYDLVGRASHEDVRERSINAMVNRYNVDETIANLVTQRVNYLATQVQTVWNLSDSDIDLMAWAGRCHEIGVAISQRHYNRHSAYMLAHSDLPGFSQGEQEMLASLVRGHRGHLPDDLFLDIPEGKRPQVSRMIALLRLAVVFKHVEALKTLPDFSVLAKGNTLTLGFPKDWRQSHPLTVWEINANKSTLGKLGIKLRLVTLDAIREMKNETDNL